MPAMLGATLPEAARWQGTCLASASTRLRLARPFIRQPAGQKQKYEDDLLRYKMGVRTETLHRRGAGAGFNPITGEVSHERLSPW